MSTLIAGIETRKITGAELETIQAPAATSTHKPVKHSDFATEVSIELAMRGIQVIKEEYAVSADGMRMFGLMVTNQEIDGCNYAIGLRNSNDKSMKIALCAGTRVMVCENMAFMGDFQVLSAMHTPNFDMSREVTIGIKRLASNVLQTQLQIERLRERVITDTTAKLLIYDSFTGHNPIPTMLLKEVNQHYFEPKYDEFKPRTAWSLHNAYTSSFKKLNPLRQFQETARLTPFVKRALELN